MVMRLRGQNGELTRNVADLSRNMGPPSGDGAARAQVGILNGSLIRKFSASCRAGGAM